MVVTLAPGSKHKRSSAKAALRALHSAQGAGVGERKNVEVLSGRKECWRSELVAGEALRLQFAWCNALCCLVPLGE